MNVMLLAAGEGTRLRPFTHILPKPAMPFLTIPLAAHSLYFLRSLEISKLVVNTFHLPNQIHSLFQKIGQEFPQLHFSDEFGEILGSGGGLSKARAHFIGGGDFILMNADEVILPRESDILNKALEHHKKSNALATLLVIDHPGVGTQFGGVWADFHGKVWGFGKKPIEGSEKAWHFVGVQILSERVFKYLPTQGTSNILYDALTQGIAAGESVQAFPFAGTWFETGNLKDFLTASRACLAFLSDPAETYQKEALRGAIRKYNLNEVKLSRTNYLQSMINSDVVIDSSSEIEGFIVAGSGAKIENSCKLRNVIIGSGVVVPAKTQAFDTILI